MLSSEHSPIVIIESFPFLFQFWFSPFRWPAISRTLFVFLTSSHLPQTIPLSSFCHLLSPHTQSPGSWPLTALTCIGCCARADGGEEWEKRGNSTWETPPGNISRCLFCSPEEAWLEWERTNGFLLGPQYSNHSSELGWLSPLGYLLLKLWADSLHLLT